MRDRRGVAGIFRVIAGGYLIYLGVKLIRDGLLTGSMQGNAKIIGIVASIAFIVFGALFAVHAIMFMSRISREEQEEEENNGKAVEEVPAEEPVPGAPSLFDRASRTVILDEDEEEPDDEV